MNGRNYLSYILNPLELLRTKKVLHVNPTIVPERAEPEEIKIYVYDFDSSTIDTKQLSGVQSCFHYVDSPKVTWLNVDGLRKNDVETICNHYGIHNLIVEDILSLGQRPKMDEINGLVFCLMNMLYFNEQHSAVETEQLSLILGKNFVISFQEDASRDVFNPLREKLKIAGTKVRQQGADFLFYSLIDLVVDNYFLVMEKLGE